MAFDGEKFGKEVVAAVRDYLERNLSPMAAHIEQLEARILLLEAQLGGAKEMAKPVVRLAAATRVAKR
ncbi:hypothetical protein [Rhizobium giardinii]|uniref:hypothetical protein n=1 Tax=Rhizobium giardinii TaxID=56731 RepID=UPI003D6F0886